MSAVCCLFRYKTRIWISVYQYFILMYSFTTKILLIFNGIEINPETFWCTWSNMSEQHVKAPNCRSPPYMVRISLCPSHMNKGFKEMGFFLYIKNRSHSRAPKPNKDHWILTSLQGFICLLQDDVCQSPKICKETLLWKFLAVGFKS